MPRHTLVMLGVSLVLVVGCGGSPAPTPSFLAGRWTCTTPGEAAPDSAEVKADGTITITKPTGESFTGTWEVSGATMTVHGLGATGTETWTIDGERLTNAIGQACTRGG